jgi:PEGA domain
VRTDRTIKVSIVTTPPGVRVLLGADASPAGLTPLDLKVKRGDQPVRLHFVKDGFEPLDQQLTPMLHPLPQPPPVPPKTTASKPKLRPATRPAPTRPVDGLLAPSY